ncbi:hypothetical protein SMF913_27835 [Streptomyces malaysiensis]|uniref:Uncharacterized protein n=1 Tax=Streptomyces malaysiensis TaxID=92644 RepID=A0A2J7YWG7_STRMQ|nr:hypothetical protein SMF913_27835 [Streptomyces malaysiensis]
MPMKPNWIRAASQPGIRGSSPPPESSGSDSSESATAYGSIDTRNPAPTQAQNTSGTPGSRIPHGRARASPRVIPTAAMPTVTVLSTTHSASPNPAPTGARPSSEPTTHDTLITAYGAMAAAPPYAASRPIRSHRSIELSFCAMRSSSRSVPGAASLSGTIRLRRAGEPDSFPGRTGGERKAGRIHSYCAAIFFIAQQRRTQFAALFSR